VASIIDYRNKLCEIIRKMLYQISFAKETELYEAKWFYCTADDWLMQPDMPHKNKEKGNKDTVWSTEIV